MIVTFIGPPGSGKGTQAALIASKLGVTHLSTGDVLRSRLESGDKESKALRKVMESGKLVPSNVVNELVLSAIKDSSKGCILDGYPRNLAQAEFLDQNCEDDVTAIYFDISHDLLIKRIAGRFSCSKCGKIYNGYFSPPKVEKSCDKCQSHNFTHRADDNAETVAVRLNEYDRETKPLVQYYQKLGRLQVVDASKSVDKISEELQLMLKSD